MTNNIEDLSINERFKRLGFTKSYGEERAGRKTHIFTMGDKQHTIRSWEAALEIVEHIESIYKCASHCFNC